MLQSYFHGNRKESEKVINTNHHFPDLGGRGSCSDYFHKSLYVWFFMGLKGKLFFFYFYTCCTGTVVLPRGHFVFFSPLSNGTGLLARIAIASLFILIYYFSSLYIRGDLQLSRILHRIHLRTSGLPNFWFPLP